MYLNIKNLFVKYIVLFIICIFCSSFGFSQNKSNINFIIKNVGIGVDGHFENINIETGFDTKGKLVHIKGVIQVASIKTGIDSRDEHLLNDDYFNAKNYKNISLVSKTIAPIDNGIFNVVATLTIKGKSKDIRIVVHCIRVDNQYKITSNFEINRSHFDVGARSLVLSNTVKIKALHFHKL